MEPPQTSTELKDELARLREERLARKALRPVGGGEPAEQERRL